MTPTDPVLTGRMTPKTPAPHAPRSHDAHEPRSESESFETALDSVSDDAQKPRAEDTPHQTTHQRATKQDTLVEEPGDRAPTPDNRLTVQPGIILAPEGKTTSQDVSQDPGEQREVGPVGKTIDPPAVNFASGTSTEDAETELLESGKTSGAITRDMAQINAPEVPEVKDPTNTAKTPAPPTDGVRESLTAQPQQPVPINPDTTGAPQQLVASQLNRETQQAQPTAPELAGPEKPSLPSGVMQLSEPSKNDPAPVPAKTEEITQRLPADPVGTKDKTALVFDADEAGEAPNRAELPQRAPRTEQPKSEVESTRLTQLTPVTTAPDPKSDVTKPASVPETDVEPDLAPRQLDRAGGAPETGQTGGFKPGITAMAPAQMQQSHTALAALEGGQAHDWRLAPETTQLQQQQRVEAQAQTQITRAQPIAEQITVAIASRHEGRIEMRLDPPELGRVQIQMQASDEGVRAVVMAERPETQDLLRRNSEQLSRELRESGFDDVTLDFGAGRDTSTGQSDDTAEERLLNSGTSGTQMSRADAIGNTASAKPERRPLTTSGLDIRL